MERVFDSLGTKIYKRNKHVGYVIKWRCVEDGHTIENPIMKE